MAGKDKIIAGSLKTKIQGHAAEILPDAVSAEHAPQDVRASLRHEPKSALPVLLAFGGTSKEGGPGQTLIRPVRLSSYGS